MIWDPITLKKWDFLYHQKKDQQETRGPQEYKALSHQRKERALN